MTCPDCDAEMHLDRDPRKVAGGLDIFLYDILEVSEAAPPTQREVLQRLQSWGLKTCPLNKPVHTMQALRRYHARLAARREKLEYEIDGVVVKADERALHEEMGLRARSPRWAMAWKFEPRQEVSTLEGIVVQVGRTGVLTPVALLAPVDVGGVTVSRATLHNADEIRRKDVRVGDAVRIVRAGDVIPEVQERLKRPGKKRGRSFSMPKTCPACGGRVVREGAFHRCVAGLSCPAQLAARIRHYAQRDALDIPGLGEKTASQLVSSGLVNDLADLYALKRDQLRDLEGFAEKSASALHEAIQQAKTPRLEDFLHALGMPETGRRTAHRLARALGSLKAVRQASRSRLEKVPGIGAGTAAAIHAFFRQAENRDVLRRMREAGVRIRDAAAESGRKPLRGETFVLTGRLSKLSRGEARDRIESRGGRVVSSVSGETDYLVAGESPGSKLDEAKRRGVKVLDERKFGRLLASKA